MPDFVTPDRVHYEYRAGGIPLLRIDVEDDALSNVSLGAMECDEIPLTPVPGWSILPSVALTVLDGPGDTGFLTAMLDATEESMDVQLQWVEAVERSGGTAFLLTTQLEHTSTGQGGFAALAE